MCKIISSDLLHLFIGTRNQNIISTCYLNVIPNLTRNSSPYGIIENVVTDKHMRNQGHGKRIIQHALGYAWKKDCYKVMLQTGSSRESTLHFYKSCGFNMNEKIAFISCPIVK
jgi:GNAT superfamily N-acetyltransferase